MEMNEKESLAAKAREAGFSVNVDSFGRLELVSVRAGRSAVSGNTAGAVPNNMVVKEAIRTITRLEKTELINRYISAIVHLAQCSYPEDPEFKSIVVTGGPKPLAKEKMDQLQAWVNDHPLYIFSLVVGLAANDENMAWGLAHG